MFTSLADLKDYCKVTDTAHDTLLTAIINRVEADLDGRAQSFGGKILQATYTDEAYDVMPYDRVIVTKRFPILSVTSVRVHSGGTLLGDTVLTNSGYPEGDDSIFSRGGSFGNNAATAGELATYTYTTSRVTTPFTYTRKHITPVSFSLYEGIASAFVTYTAGFNDVHASIKMLAFDLSVEKYLDSFKKESRFGKTSDSPNITGSDSKSYERFTNADIMEVLTNAFTSIQ